MIVGGNCFHKQLADEAEAAAVSAARRQGQQAGSDRASRPIDRASTPTPNGGTVTSPRPGQGAPWELRPLGLLTNLPPTG